MLTLLLQSLLADVMSNSVAPAVSRVVLKVVPSAPPAAVHEAVERLFRPAAWNFSEGSQQAWRAALSAPAKEAGQ
ncbi:MULTISPECIES: hypothetical protein [Aeromicrobium]|uniref:hypothetical protein n=1 Tax=Aeromicrobium TaxID=2040 RepID=UPI00257AEBB4|nr:MULTISPECIES: hypothetical protein [Aeromicrobium]